MGDINKKERKRQSRQETPSLLCIDSQSVTTVEVFTFEGKQVFVVDNFGRAVIQLNQHPAGIYIMKISDGKNTQIKKFMKQ